MQNIVDIRNWLIYLHENIHIYFYQFPYHGLIFIFWNKISNLKCRKDMHWCDQITVLNLSFDILQFSKRKMQIIKMMFSSNNNFSLTFLSLYIIWSFIIVFIPYKLIITFCPGLKVFSLFYYMYLVNYILKYRCCLIYKTVLMLIIVV